MVYLKKLPPPMVDVDISLLCQGDWDEEGVHLVGLALQFLLEELRWVGGGVGGWVGVGLAVAVWSCVLFCARGGGSVKRFGNRARRIDLAFKVGCIPLYRSYSQLAYYCSKRSLP